MKINTNELTGAALDWAVAKCEGEEYRATVTGNCIGMLFDPHRYSTDWDQGGPIIDRMADAGLQLRKGGPTAGNQRCWASLDSPNRFYHGQTMLIAAMRCYVASKLGDVVDVPDELARG